MLLTRLFVPARPLVCTLTLLALLATVAPARPVAADIADAPQLHAPIGGVVLLDFSPMLVWSNPPETTQVQLQVTPIGQDGPGLNLIVSERRSFAVPAPPDWYGLLPDMTYTWRVRASDAPRTLDEDDPRWGPWSEMATFRTPRVSTATVTLLRPTGAQRVDSRTPTLVWANSDPNVFYYEVQLSVDPTFGTSIAGPVAPVYWELRHGGLTIPPNSYTVPQGSPLQADRMYFWRVRPRIQGDGTPLPWTPVATFRTPPGDL